MSTRQLSEVILNDQLRQPNFANGRLLSAEDLRQEQSSRIYAEALLGKAVGDGIVSGLEVTGTGAAPTVQVSPGSAVNRKGTAFALPEAVDLSLVRPTAPATSTVTAIFRDCQPTQAGVFVADAGLYLLALSPVNAMQGRAPVSGLGVSTTPCAAQFQAHGVQFRLIPAPLTAAPAEPALIRNHAAYACFGLVEVPLTKIISTRLPWQRTGLLDRLRASNVLTDCDVPLALVHWTSAGLQFVDLWSVRRRVTHPNAAKTWLLYDDRHLSDAEAMVQQFQQQVDSILASTTTPETVQASTLFEFLPPAGIVPLKATSSRGLDYTVFFKGLAFHDPAFLQSGRAEALLRSAILYPPIDLRSGDAFWLYQVMQGPNALPFMIFTNINVPFQAESRFDIASWDQSTFA